MKLRLYYPVRPFSINQHFGDNKPCVKDFGLPTQIVSDGPVCPIGYDKLYPHFGMSGHNGTDLLAGEQYIYAACDGVVIEKQIVPARGFGIGILTNEQYEVAGGEFFIKLRYWHLKTILVEVGDKIVAGQIIGITDNTGYSSGNHLHFEGQPMKKDEGGHPVVAFGNGTFGGEQIIAGAANMEPYFTGIYADDLSALTNKYIGLIKLLTMMVAYLKK